MFFVCDWVFFGSVTIFRVATLSMEEQGSLLWGVALLIWGEDFVRYTDFRYMDFNKQFNLALDH